MHSLMLACSVVCLNKVGSNCWRVRSSGLGSVWFGSVNPRIPHAMSIGGFKCGIYEYHGWPCSQHHMAQYPNKDNIDAVKAHSCVDTSSEIHWWAIPIKGRLFWPEDLCQLLTLDPRVFVNCLHLTEDLCQLLTLDPRVFVNCLHCKQLTKTFGLKRPALEWLIVVYCSSVNFTTG